MTRKLSVLSALGWMACCCAIGFAQTPIPIPASRAKQRLQQPGSLRLAALNEDEAPRPLAKEEARTPASSSDRMARIPSISIQTMGPHQVILGKAAEFAVVVENTDTVTAEQIRIELALPKHLQVVVVDATAGDAQRSERSSASTVVWTIPHILSHGREQLRLSVTSSVTQPFAMSISSSLSSASSIDVLEPKLEVSLDGPDDVVYGEDANLVLTVHNSGTGPAENVTIDLLPRANGAEPIPVGDLEAGAERQMEFSVPANVAGTHRLRAVAVADRGVENDASHVLLVRRADVQFEVAGPETEYAGTSVHYQISCHNEGNATAQQLIATCVIPDGLQYTGGLEGAEQNGNTLTWEINDLAVGQQRTFELECLAVQPGEKAFQITAIGDANVQTISTLTTEIRAVADLKLVIHDTPTPRAVGEDTVFEIRISNRGTEAARDISVAAYCAKDVQPVDVTGNAAIENGSVFFQPIAVLEPGKTAVLKVNARGTKSGSFPFRVEVECVDPETRLVTEETVRFFTRARVGSNSSDKRRR